MSLLTSPQTTREQHKFLGKLQKQFNQKSFYNSNYVQAPSLLQQVNDNTDRAHQQITEAMQSFLGQLSSIIAQSRNSRIDYYFILNEMKSVDFFSEVAGMIAQDILQRNNRIERQNMKLREETKKYLQRLRELQRGQTPKPPPNTPDLRFNGIKSIAENLYEKAKILSAQEFVSLCDRTLLGEKVVIKKVSGQKSEQQLLRRISVALQNGKNSRHDEIMAIINELKGQANQQSRCNQPCCQTLAQKQSYRQSKAVRLRRSSDARRSKEVYQDDRSEQYFNRYYRKSQFDMKKVISIQKTKLEQMEKIEDDYRVNLKQRKKNYTLFSR